MQGRLDDELQLLRRSLGFGPLPLIVTILLLLHRLWRLMWWWCRWRHLLFFREALVHPLAVLHDVGVRGEEVVLGVEL